MKRLKTFLCASSLVMTATQASAGCVVTPTPCMIEQGEYHIELPETANGAAPAIVFLHGYGSSGEGVLRNRRMVDAVLNRGYALIAPNGTSDEGRDGGSWSFHPDFPKRRDELAFISSVIQDAVDRHNLNPDRILLSGFSIGGSTTSYLACKDPDIASAYAPVGGGFWRPHPTDCAGPVQLLHTHGWRDTTVPLEGRYLRNGAIAQGDIFHGMDIWRQTNGCDAMRADEFETDGPFWRRKWERCSDGSALEFALFPGGHSIPRGWATMAIDWFEGL